MKLRCGILRFATIVLLGLQLTFEQVRSVGVVGFSIVAFTLFATFFVTRWISRAVGGGSPAIIGADRRRHVSAAPRR